MAAIPDEAPQTTSDVSTISRSSTGNIAPSVDKYAVGDKTSQKSGLLQIVQEAWGTDFSERLGVPWPQEPGRDLLELLAKVATKDNLTLFPSRIAPIVATRELTGQRFNNYLIKSDLENY